MGKVYGYIRVSSDKQTVENQRFEVLNFCKRKEIKVNDWIEETISGTKANGNAQIFGSARVGKRAEIDDHVKICGAARVCAPVSGHTIIGGEAVIIL